MKHVRMEVPELQLPITPLKPEQTAERTVTLPQAVFAVGLLLVSALMVWQLGWILFFFVFLVPITILYLINFLFLTAVTARSLKTGMIEVPNVVLEGYKDEDLPRITMLIPLFKEGNKEHDVNGELVYDGEENVIKPLITNLKRIDYPLHKKEVLFLLEEECEETIEAVTRQLEQQNLVGPNIRVFVIPPGMETYKDSEGKEQQRRTEWYPQTKPKACNVGLRYATGEYLVIFDAEDQPEIDQARKAVHALSTSPENVICAQAKLEYRNPNTNLLTRLFAAEYATYFNLVVPGLAKFGFPVPLGGTSNWFKVSELRKVGAWDPYNVTEDMDLGIRIARAGLKVVVLDSVTWEEATSKFFGKGGWLKQRSRWKKGRGQTYLVHTRDLWKLLRDLKFTKFNVFHIVIGAPCLMLLINPIFWIITALYVVFQVALIRELYPTPLLYVGIISMTLGNLAFIFYLMTGCMLRGPEGNVKWSLFMSIPYWGLMSVATYRALWQLITRPHFWDRTIHGRDMTGVTHEEEQTATLSGGR